MHWFFMQVHIQLQEQLYLLSDAQKNASYIKNVDIYDENEGPVVTRMLEEVTTLVAYVMPSQ